MKNTLAENMRRFHTKNLSEQVPKIINPTQPSGAQSAPKVGLNGSNSKPTNNQEFIRKIGRGVFTDFDSTNLNDPWDATDWLRAVKTTLAPDQKTYDATRAQISNEFNKAGIIHLLASLGVRNSTTHDVYTKIGSLGTFNSGLDEYRENLNKIEYYLRQFGNPKEKWSLYVK